MKKWQIPFLILLIVGTVLIIRQQRSAPYNKCSGAIFGTVYNITYQSSDDLEAELVACMQQVDSALSMFNPQSVISKVNMGEQEIPQNKTGRMFGEVVQLATQISADTDGAFDITVAPLVNAWGFGFKSGNTPTPSQVDSIRQFVGYQKVQYVTGDGRQTLVKSDPRTMLDCSAIAKGYGVDQVAQLLETHGVTNYMVEIGGEIATRGVNDKRLPWRIGVTKPTDDGALGGELQTVINVTDKCMATSGNYRNYYVKEGKRYAHTINPKTGHPVQHNILSATVLSDQCARADAFATAFMVMGLDGACKVLEQHPELMAYLIYDEKGKTKVWCSPSLKDKIKE